ncbi:autotransporter outer membrane beta-barrel domain-containing protein [Campylobacter sp. MIT 21-1685]|uniref:autotransporter outer membrane beta-barrel domain-containing protein n=1 Tax=unclassified Campylobacter TaxID=2593542 RepID=UPI00224AC77E|nr:MULTISPECIES: autotransporter outer membrane beta-barrel domain-containing protein [unclassified Campylobacter]MCX2683030.1 autotransporter outer membrane beta-barrel domain-containing protein [Campylobacter sp. MIT 21-1684]MCX2751312.1 autotransporter outer membrane beta-barrel domain-containing protein [Campylobacter sp. MIT 21-1682]MCX2807511.1 autotransporter outer membrane beta-barrel domain-containing protein [Campylobacter sp. MIT 21-1685]
MKKIQISLMILSSSLFSADITSLNSNIFLMVNEKREDRTISTKGNGVGYYIRSQNTPLNVSGPSGSSYTLNADNDLITFYLGKNTVNSSATLNFKGYNTLAYENGGILVNSGGTYNAEMSNNIINAQFTDYGGASKVRFSSRANLELKQNATANFSKMKFFIADSQVILEPTSRLNVQAETIRIQKTLTNDNAHIQFTGDVYNIGSPIAGFLDSISTFEIRNKGNVIVDGDFYNGGDAKVDAQTGLVLNPFDANFSGGGDLRLNDAFMEVKGKFVSVEGGDLSVKASSVDLYGSVLKVGNGFENKKGSSLTFGIYNDVMGKLDGSLNNDKGIVFVDTTGVKEQDYQIITGTITGLSEIQLKNPNNNLVLACKDGSISVTKALVGQGAQSNIICTITPQISPSLPVNPSPVPSNPVPPSTTNKVPVTVYDSWKGNLDTSKSQVVSLLENKFGGEIFSLGSSQELDLIVDDIETSTKNYTREPTKILNAFKADTTLSMPVHFIPSSELLASGEHIVLDNGASLGSPLVFPENKNIYVNTFGGVLKGNNLDGYLIGMNLGFNHFSDTNFFQAQFSYAYGNNEQNLKTQNTTTRSRLYAWSLYDKIAFYSNYESELKASVLAGKFDISREYNAAVGTVLNTSEAEFNAYQVNLGGNIGYRFGEELSFKPYIGLEHYIDMQKAFKEDGGLGLQSRGYTHYLLALALGSELKYEKERYFYYAKLHYENKLYNSHKSVFFEFDRGNRLRYTNEYDNTLSLILGTQLFVYSGLRLNIEALYRNYSSGVNFFGGNLLFKYVF